MADQVHNEGHNPPAAMVPVPHGPQADTNDLNDYPVADASEEERRIFYHVTRPDDMYTPEGVYWADLPIMQRIKFCLHIDGMVAREELAVIGRMIRKDPLSPIGWYFRNSVIPGAGLGLEGYVLFSIGNLTPLFAQVWPDCWSDGITCNINWVNSITYLEIAGIMVGQVLVGVLGDWIGRRWGLIQDAVVMFVGLIMLCAAWGVNLNGWVICYAWSLFFYSIGVGGEYPMTATAALENAVTEGRMSTREDRLHRGRRVTLAFLMQGWGQFFNQLVCIVLLVIFNGGSDVPPYSALSAQFTYRLSFALPAVGTLWLCYYRTWKLPSASAHLDAAKRRVAVKGYDVGALKMTFKYFGSRVVATAGGWFCNDVFFYGNKLFQSSFIKVITDSSSLYPNWTWNLVNITVELCGYYLACFLVDNKLYGRKWMQQVGFFMCFIMFVIPAFKYEHYTSPAGIHGFQAMYFISSFFNQFGPNSITFLVAGEVFPTPIRATAHGFSACCGKLGALFAAILYVYVTDSQKRFYIVPWFGLIGMLLTFFFLPDTTGLDLQEQERRWGYLRSGRGKEYHGIAVHPQHLSVWERICGESKTYNPEMDWKSKVEDMRTEWELSMANRGPKETDDGALPNDLTGDFTPEVHAYFSRNGPSNGKLGGIMSSEKTSEVEN